MSSFDGYTVDVLSVELTDLVVSGISVVCLVQVECQIFFSGQAVQTSPITVNDAVIFFGTEL